MEEETKMIKVVTKLPNEEAKVVEMENRYGFIRKFCKGTIDMIGFPNDNKASIICNDEFLMNGMEPNIIIPEREEVFCGPLIFAGYDPETSETVSLSAKQVETIKKYCEKNSLQNMKLKDAYDYLDQVKDKSPNDWEAY